MHLDLLVCLSGRVTQKLLLRLTHDFYRRSIIPVARCSSLEDDPDLDSIFRILKWEKNMPSKYATTSNVRYDENMHYYVTASEGLSSLIAVF